MIRHGKKDGENIAEAQLAEIVKNGILAVNPLVFGKKVRLHEGTEYDRTRQIINAYSQYLTNNGNCEIVGRIPRDTSLGNKKLFDEWMANPEVVADAEKRSWYQAFEDYSPMFIGRVQYQALCALRDLFSQIEENEIIISVGHTPMIEWLAIIVDELNKSEKIGRDIKLAELTGFAFTKENGRIAIAAQIGW